MKLTVQHPQFEQIDYEENIWSGKKHLFVNGARLASIDKTTFILNGEEKKFCYLKGSIATGIRLTIDQEVIELAPKTKWYEWVCTVALVCFVIVWGNSPALCAIVPIVGGAIGGAISGAMAMLNLMLMKKQDNIGIKLAIWLGMLLATFVLCFLGFQMLIGILFAAL